MTHESSSHFSIDLPTVTPRKAAIHPTSLTAAGKYVTGRSAWNRKMRLIRRSACTTTRFNSGHVARRSRLLGRVPVLKAKLDRWHDEWRTLQRAAEMGFDSFGDGRCWDSVTSRASESRHSSSAFCDRARIAYRTCYPLRMLRVMAQLHSLRSGEIPLDLE